MASNNGQGDRAGLMKFFEELAQAAGTDLAVGQYLGYADGSRIGIWRRGQGRPEPLACIKLARWKGDDPIRVLRLAGYDEMADLLDGSVVPVTPVSLGPLQATLERLHQFLHDILSEPELAAQPSQGFPGKAGRPRKEDTRSEVKVGLGSANADEEREDRACIDLLR